MKPTHRFLLSGMMLTKVIDFAVLQFFAYVFHVAVLLLRARRTRTA